MNMKFWVVLCSAALLITQGAQATTSVTPIPPGKTVNPSTPDHADVTDYQALGLGQEGYLFFNFDPNSDSGDDPVGEDRAESLPSYITVDYDPNSAGYSFGQDVGFEAVSRGGVAGWATITLPDGTTGLSGALVDPRADNNSNNTIKNIVVGAGIKSTILLVHFVTDNTNLAHDSVNRIRPREDLSGTGFRFSNNSFNGVPDVYTAAYHNIAAGDVIKMQLNSGVGGVDPSIAGIMFDVPEPTCLALFGLGAMGLVCIRRR